MIHDQVLGLKLAISTVLSVNVNEARILVECCGFFVCLFFYSKHYREYLVSLINAHSLDPAVLYDSHDLIRACERYQVDPRRGDGEEEKAYHARLLKVSRGSLPMRIRTYAAFFLVFEVFNHTAELLFFISQKLMEVPLGEKVPRNK